MTQLPEAEVLRKDLEKDVVGKRFKDVTVKTAGIVTASGYHRNRPEFVKALSGHKIDGVGRRGTNLLFELDDDRVLVVRLGSQGSVVRETSTAEAGKHTQIVATFTTGGAIHYVDPDRDGEAYVVDAAAVAGLEALRPGGIDPLADTFTWPSFSDELRARTTKLKAALVDESLIVGLGDLYADEVLWSAGLSATRSTGSLSSQEMRRLYRAVLEVLYEAVKQRGAGEGDPGEADPFGDAEYGDHIKVFGKDGQPCQRCRRPIVKVKVSKGVDSYACPQCQT